MFGQKEKGKWKVLAKRKGIMEGSGKKKREIEGLG